MQEGSQTMRLNNGVEMPQLGLGVWKMAQGEECEQAVGWALEAGYRLIDTAALYRNEESVGKAIQKSGIPREDIFITTKLWPIDFLNPEGAFQRSLKKLGLDYVDLYLIHWPIPGMGRGIWKTLEKIYKEKQARAIGVSNYSIDDLERLYTYAEITPAVNQIKFNPFSHDLELLKFCQEHNVVLEAYTPLARGKVHTPDIDEIAIRHHKTAAQVMIRWALQHTTVVIPKSSHRERILENRQVFDFELSEEEMTKLDSLA